MKVTFQQNQVRVGIGVWVFNPTNQILLGKRKSEHGANTWALPGGKLEFGETPQHCAARELYEESGIKIPENKFCPMPIFTNDIFPNCHYVTLYYSVKNVAATPIIMEPDKCEQWAWFDRNKLPTPLFLPIQNYLSQINSTTR